MARSRDPRTVRNRIVRLLEKCDRDARLLVTATETGASDGEIARAHKLPSSLAKLRAEVLALWEPAP